MIACEVIILQSFNIALLPGRQSCYTIYNYSFYQHWAWCF